MDVRRTLPPGADDGRQERGERMSEKEKQIIETITESIPKMDDMSKGYFLGYAEAMARQKEEKEEKKDESSAV